MTALLITVIQGLSALGYGAIAMRVVRISHVPSIGLRVCLCFALGFGILGWVILPLSVMLGLNAMSLGCVLALGVAGLWGLFPFSKPEPRIPLGITQAVLVGALIVVFGFDLIEALAPPSDADSLAYHFALPKFFLDSGKIIFVPRAVDGATPLLVQMTYLPALHFGGEQALNLWAMLSGWAAVGFLYVLCREHLCRTWGLVAAVIFASTPAVIYGAGSGQVEVRISLFVMLCAWSCAQFFKSQRYPYLILAAVAAGFFGGAKVTGLIFMASVLIVLLPRRPWFQTGFVFSIVSAMVAAPWYFWTFTHTGDPLFPILYPILGVSNPLYWDQAHHDLFNLAFRSLETPLPVNLFSLFAFPFVGTLFPYPTMEAGRTGFGPIIIMLLPCALALSWVGIQKRQLNGIGIYGLIFIVFFAIWFLSGTPQRIRHLLPVLPLIILCLVYSAAWATKSWRISGVVSISLAMVIVMQLGGAGLFGIQFLNVVAGKTSRSDFLENTVSLYQPIPWLNENLKATDKLMTPIRQHMFYLDMPYFFAHAFTQAEVNISPEFSSKDLIPSLHRLGVTHVLAYQKMIDGKWLYGPKYQELIDGECLLALHSGDSVAIRSRTLGGAPELHAYSVFKFDQQACPPS